MTATEVLSETNRATHRRRPFSNWVKKLANLKSSSTSSDSDRKQRPKGKRGAKLNNPYPQSGQVSQNHGHDVPATNGTDCQSGNGGSSYSLTTARTRSMTSMEAATTSTDGRPPRTAGERSMAGTASTDNETPQSLAPSHGASSLAGTSRTIGGGMDSRREDNSTFSSPTHSVRSLTTTLTTIHSVAPNGTASPAPAAQSNSQSIQFSQPFPTAPPASAIPSHLAPTGNPTTYTTATANNLLTDNASILTLASSSKRRRRRSMDTDASVRALAPSSIWGGSRESLPLSVLSANVEREAVPTSTPGALHGSSSRIGQERSSIYSASGAVPTITSERNSIYAKQGDGASVRSGRLGHGRPDSISGSIAGVTNPLASAREVYGEKGGKDIKDDGVAEAKAQ